jgi:large subunit ribosomal protein L22
MAGDSVLDLVSSVLVGSSDNMVRVTPRKLRLVVDLIRNMPVADALLQLDFVKKACALHVKKCLLAAVANADNNFGLDVDRLYVVLAKVDKSITLKRFHARARGRGTRIKKFFSKLYIAVGEVGGIS